MAETVHLLLKINGAQVQGDSGQRSVGRDGSIECLSFEHGVVSPREAGSGIAVGRRQYRPIRLRKRIDRASPVLMQALCNNEVLSGEFRFYRPDPAGNGKTEQFYTVTIDGAYVESIQQMSEDTLVPGTSNKPPLEEVAIVFRSIRWQHLAAGTEAEDSWDNNL